MRRARRRGLGSRLALHHTAFSGTQLNGGALHAVALVQPDGTSAHVVVVECDRCRSMGLIMESDAEAGKCCVVDMSGSPEICSNR